MNAVSLDIRRLDLVATSPFSTGCWSGFRLHSNKSGQPTKDADRQSGFWQYLLSYPVPLHGQGRHDTDFPPRWSRHLPLLYKTLGRMEISLLVEWRYLYLSSLTVRSLDNIEERQSCSLNTVPASWRRSTLVSWFLCPNKNRYKQIIDTPIMEIK